MLRRILTLALCLLLIAMPVLAASEATSLRSATAVSSTGECQVTLTVTVHLESADENLVFPLPASATSVSLNGKNVSTRRDGHVRTVNLSKYVGSTGDFPFTIHYTLPNTVTAGKDGSLLLTIPLLNGFAYPVAAMEFTVTLPGEITARPSFSSGYYQDSIESYLVFTADGATVSGVFNSKLEDHETLTMTLEVPPEQFPGIRVKESAFRITDILAAACAVLALAYWLLTLRCLPAWPIRRATPPEGITAGELGSRLTLAGVDLTLMVITWAQLGYILIQMDDNGRVRLYKRMEMGNERSGFENRCFKSLFGRRKMVDGSGYHYAKLCRKVAKTSRKNLGLFQGNSGNPTLFRVLAAGICLFCGISVAVSWASSPFLRVLLILLLGGFALFSGWIIQTACQYLHLHNRHVLRAGLLCCGIWLLLGLLSGQLTLALCGVVSQIAAGIAAAYGGRRSELGKQTSQNILGLRRYLKKVTPDELHRITQANPDYFYQMAPYALALGVDRSFAKHYGRSPLPECSYLITGHRSQMSALEWNQLLRDTVEALDERQRQLVWERLLGK